MESIFITVDTAHRSCADCHRCEESAEDMARVTGSVGATDRRGTHYATVQRADKMHELHPDATPEPPARPSVFYITFGLGGPAAGLFTMVVVDAGHPDPSDAARRAAFAAYGREWAFDYAAPWDGVKKHELKQREVIRVTTDGIVKIVSA